MKITFISDTHSKHNLLNLPGGDILIHSGDLMNSGKIDYEIYSFCHWLNKQPYKTKIFIGGNHDRLFEESPNDVKDILKEFEDINYLEDSFLLRVNDDLKDSVKIWGSPWQPEFHNWAFNLPRGGNEIKSKWDLIPEDIDILITHGPPQGHLDTSGPPWNEPNLGCEMLRLKVNELKPKIHVFGHIHGGSGYKFYEGTHFINASVLDERYHLRNPHHITVEWNKTKNSINFL